MKKKILSTLVILIFIFICWIASWVAINVYNNANPCSRGVACDPPVIALPNSNMIAVDNPDRNQVVGKQFLVTGKARGGWYFEASFPVVILDKDGKVLVSSPAQAQGDWMTTEFVPFTATMTIPVSYKGKATIILKKDNPSGLPEKDASISFPITIEY